MMGWIGSAGSIGRVIMPIAAGLLPHDVNFILCSVISLASGLLVIIYDWSVQHHKRQTIRLSHVNINDSEVTTPLINNPIDQESSMAPEENTA